jgi:steroid 5-alpha reductase family enzyme
VIEHRWELWLLGWALAAAILFALYLVQLRTCSATAVDAGWAGSIAAVGVLYAILGPGDVSHRVLIAVVLGIENLRIASLVFGRIGKGEDTRYVELRRRWRERGREQLTFAVFYQAQALVAALLTLPALLVVFNRHRGLTAIEWVGAAVWVCAFALEWTADRQLSAFRADESNHGKTMRSGLWRYSRHPNYFFQTMTWVAYALIATAAPWSWLAWLAPAFICFLVLFVTGVPPAEESSLRSRGDDFRRYQAETSVFVPWFPKKQPAKKDSSA